eukprot:CAMPEP_0198430434 /NCGR_PEP_ID=MMETSP1452-20131203/13475_1 /TAXON_ID=1181717 /ORGANISM="Synchroma pusillum, Strain CCMP3072" /LENGTH=266 /DNA_ID=CAMNT_0044150873 /DNA_START=51 /DNA_END=848 /DNA_ORIENTATION=-
MMSRMLQACQAVVPGLCHGSARGPTESEAALARELQALLATRFDLSDPEHEALLHRLWRAAASVLPEVAAEEYTHPSTVWKFIGFQSENPESDLSRGGGVLALHCLIYVFEKHGEVVRPWHTLVRERRKDDVMLSYPFAASSISVTIAVLRLLGLVGLAGNPNRELPPHERWGVLRDLRSYFRLYTAAFMMVEQIFVETNATYMTFNTTVKGMEERMGALMARRDATVEDVEAAVDRRLVAPDDGVAGEVAAESRTTPRGARGGEG